MCELFVTSTELQKEWRGKYITLTGKQLMEQNRDKCQCVDDLKVFR